MVRVTGTITHNSPVRCPGDPAGVLTTLGLEETKRNTKKPWSQNSTSYYLGGLHCLVIFTTGFITCEGRTGTR